MIVEHLESYEIALVIWSFLFILLGLQGLISVYLDGEVEQVEVRPAKPAPWPVVWFMLLLTAANVGTAWEFAQQLFHGASPSSLGQLAALLLFILAALIGLYRRYFIADVVVAQERDDGVPW
ncbi:MAG TPA: hypothetical protein ENI60_00465 [Candidatus Fraserbacteria bacterium]|nr:hypothetical protein [Candidatus Fraserbacteria bacterium]